MARVALKTAFPEYIINRLFTSTQFQRPPFQTIKAESLQKVCISADMEGNWFATTPNTTR